MNKQSWSVVILNYEEEQSVEVFDIGIEDPAAVARSSSINQNAIAAAPVASANTTSISSSSAKPSSLNLTTKNH